MTSSNWNEYNLKLLTRNNWRKSRVPAPAVILAPIAYVKFVAVKKLVVGFDKLLEVNEVAPYWGLPTRAKVTSVTEVKSAFFQWVCALLASQPIHT